MKISKLILSLVLLIIALVSHFVLQPRYSTPDGFYKKYITSLDDKKQTAMTLSASTAATSAIITALPNDWATPIAEQLASLSKGFLLILSVLYVEKYIMPLLGALSTGIIIPSICLLLIIILWSRIHSSWRTVALRLLLLAVTSMFIIPVGIEAGNIIERTYEESIQVTYRETLNSEEELSKVNEQEEKPWWQKITDSIGDFFSKVFNGASELYFNAKNAIARAVESFAITLVIDCAIPLFVLIAYIIIIKQLFNLKFSLRSGVNRSIRAIRPKPRPKDIVKQGRLENQHE